MFKFHEVDEFYPTPKTLLEKVFDGLDWRRIRYILEPSAGKGDICDYIREKANSYPYYNSSLEFDCIEMDENLQKILAGKDYPVVHDNFLTFRTFKKYDLIVMNPPFSTGAAHLLKALSIAEKNGGNIVCILNAETIKNPYTNERKSLQKKLEELQAEIEFYEHEFDVAERKTSVEVAVVKAMVPEPVEEDSYIWEELKTKKYSEKIGIEATSVVVADYIQAAIQGYEMEIEAGIKLMKEYQALSPYLLSSLDKDNKYNKPIIQLKVGGEDRFSVNKYVELIREKYWTALFKDKRFTGKMTTKQYEQYASKVQKLKSYDFSLYNILTLQEEMTKNLIKGIEDCIIELFDELSRQYHWAGNGTDKNIHYYNGWKTNKAWIINKKVILPYINAWSNYDNHYQPTNWNLLEKLNDIEKALNYLDGGLSYGSNIAYVLQNAERTGQTKNVSCKYFNVTFYKKGTMHLEFTNLELLKKLNIFGSQQKRWLPPSYGKKAYTEMDAEERAIIDEFEGQEEYEKTLARADYYIYDPKTSIPRLEQTA